MKIDRRSKIESGRVDVAHALISFLIEEINKTKKEKKPKTEHETKEEKRRKNE